MCELGWPGIFIGEEHGGQELGVLELGILCEELGYALAPSPFFSNAAAGLMIQHAGSDEQRSRWLPGIASGEQRGTVAYVENGVASLVPDADSADVIVLFDSDSDTASVVATGDAQVETVDTIDSTRRFSRVTPSGSADELTIRNPAVLLILRDDAGKHVSQPVSGRNLAAAEPQKSLCVQPDICGGVDVIVQQEEAGLEGVLSVRPDQVIFNRGLRIDEVELEAR